MHADTAVVKAQNHDPVNMVNSRGFMAGLFQLLILYLTFEKAR